MRVILIILLMFSFPAAVVAGIYRWVDENGQVHFGNIPPKQQKQYRSGDEELVTTNKTGNKKGGKAGNKDRKKNPGSMNEAKKGKSTNVKKEKNSNKISAGKIKDKKAKRVKNEKTNIKSKISTKRGISENTKNKGIANSVAPAKAADIKENEKLNDLLKRLRDKNDHPVRSRANEKVDNELTSKPKINTVKNITNDKNIELKGDSSKREPSGKRKPHKKFGKGKNGEKINSREKAKHRDSNVKEKIESKIKPSSTNKKIQSEKCGFFSGYVDTYQYRIKYECPGENCDLLKKELDKYKKKAALYCNN